MMPGTSHGELVIALDNGGSDIKIGIAGEAAPRRVFPNCTAKPKGERQVYVGDMLLECQEVSQLAIRRPIDRGYLVNWDLESEIWSRAFKALLQVNPRSCGLLMTEPLFNFPQVQAVTEQVVFEDFGFQSFYSAPAPLFSLRRHAQQRPDLPASQAMAGVVLDLGFSFSHIVPIFNGQVLLSSVRRINVGGKALTNYLKELVSYRSLNMMDETYLMEGIKEQLCFVSLDTAKDLRLAQQRGGPHRREFVLPDGVNNLRGYVRDPTAPQQPPQPPAAVAGQGGGSSKDQVLMLNNERFLVPEVLFHPRDIGLDQAGLPEATVQAVSATHAALQPLLCSNVLLTGGMVRCPNLLPRYSQELRPLVPQDYPLNTFAPQDPSLIAWEGMSLFGASPDYPHVAMTKGEYEETGGMANTRQGRKRHDDDDDDDSDDYC